MQHGNVSTNNALIRMLHAIKQLCKISSADDKITEAFVQIICQAPIHSYPGL